MLSPSPRPRFGSISISLLVIGISVVFLGSCGRKNSEEAPMTVDKVHTAPMSSPPATGSGRVATGTYDAVSDSATAEVAKSTSSSAARVNPADSAHKFLRTADLRFKTKDVVKTTYQIEDIVAGVGGYVSNTSLKSDVDEKTSTPISEDSLIEVTNYTVSNIMTIRVPDVKLDSTLKAIAPLVEYLDHRTVTAQDVSLDILANSISARRQSAHSKRLSGIVDAKGKKIDQMADVEEQALSAAEGADDAIISNLRYADQIKYSTIQLSLYQRPSVMKQMLINPKGVEQYKPNIGLQLMESLAIGWRMFESIAVSIVKLWSIILLIVLGYLGFRYFQKKAATAE